MKPQYFPSPALLLIGLLMFVLPQPLPADALSRLPAAWQDRLQAVPETDVSGTERIAREAITGTRDRLAELLQSGTNDNKNLAEGYGELAALYQLFHIDSAAALQCHSRSPRGFGVAVPPDYGPVPHPSRRPMPPPVPPACQGRPGTAQHFVAGPIA